VETPDDTGMKEFPANSISAGVFLAEKKARYGR
jgi:hypothetical protein